MYAVFESNNPDTPYGQGAGALHGSPEPNALHEYVINGGFGKGQRDFRQDIFVRVFSLPTDPQPDAAILATAVSANRNRIRVRMLTVARFIAGFLTTCS